MDEEEARLPEELAQALRALLEEIAGEARPCQLLDLAEALQARLDGRNRTQTVARSGISGAS